MTTARIKFKRRNAIYLKDFELQYQERSMLFNIVEEKMFSILLGDARSWLLLYLMEAVIEVPELARETNIPACNERSMM